jgi:hypothetical protein
MKYRPLLALVIIFCCFGTAGTSQTLRKDYSTIRVSDWVMQKSDTLDYALSEYGGARAFLMKRKAANSKSASIAYPKDLDFTNGSIELDIASPNGKQGFVGIAFHVQDSNHYETLYFRPGSSGTVYAIQYMPEKKPEFNWWDYEDSSWQATAILPETGWFHVKVVVKGRKMKVYLNHQPTAVVSRTDLDPGLPHGSVGFWLGNCPTGAYKNLRIEKTE